MLELIKKKMETVRLHIINGNSFREFEIGKSLKEVAAAVCPKVTDAKTGIEFPVIAAIVDHQLKELDYKIVYPEQIEFIGYNHLDGRRTYIRSLCFVLQNSIRNLFPEKQLIVDYSLPSGLYCYIKDTAVSPEDVKRIKAEMKKIISEDHAFIKKKVSNDKAVELFTANNQPEKVKLLKSRGRFMVSVYYLQNQVDTFYGPLAPSTGQLKYFELLPFGNGFCIQVPGVGEIAEMLTLRTEQSKIAAALEKHSEWCRILGINGVGSLNKFILDGNAVKLINYAEARHEMEYVEIAEKIYRDRDRIKFVFIAGPSSSGKTSSSLRLAIQCKVLGLNPKVIELDNYFVNRENTPKDEKGEYDYESLYAMDLDFLNGQLNDLLSGKKVEIPKFNFKEGRREFNGNFMQLEEGDILIMEGIHALNPAMITSVDNSRIFRVYASALTSLSIDENNNTSTADNRLLRRIIRDNRTRGINPEESILRWNSVRRGENRNIFPFQENADAIFNSALIFELPVLKYYAEPLLRRISPNSPAYSEAIRLLKFLDYIVALSPEEISAIPPTSIIREFIGGQTL